MKEAFEGIERSFPDSSVAAAVYNAGSPFLKKPFLELGVEEFEGGLKANA